MKKNLIISGLLLLFSHAANSQVGINNTSPKATLDITAKTADGTKPEGVIAPRLSGDEIKMADSMYGSDQMGTFIYATSPVTVPSTKTENITSPGYYFFDGTIWRKFTEPASTGSTFVPYVVASGLESSTVNITNTYTKLNFTVSSINDGNWDSASNTYTVAKTGFYEISFQAIMKASTSSNSFNWVLSYSGSLYTLASTVNVIGGATNSYNYGGAIVLYLAQNTILEFGVSTPCSTCTSTYSVLSRTFSINYLGQ